MKSITMPGTVVLDDKIRKQLFHEVKETIALDIHCKKKKRFTPADLWFLQRNKRSAGGLIYKK